MRVAFLANTYHLSKTRSSQFFIDLLEEWFGAVHVIPHQDVWLHMPGCWDLVIVWQHRFQVKELESFGARSVVLVPMYDDCWHDYDSWKPYQKFKVLCFSRALADLLEPWGFECLRVTYRPPVPDVKADFSQGLHGFFWPRTSALDWRQIGVLIRGTEWHSFQIHTAQTPPEAVVPSSTEPGVGRLIQTEWFDRPGDYVEALEQTNVFFAPRLLEGIGMAFLEALSRGMAVVAPHLPTANEYITSGVDGWLFDAEHPAPIDFKEASQWGAKARLAAQTGREAWESQLPVIRRFLETEYPNSIQRVHLGLVLWKKSVAWLRQGYRALKRHGGQGIAP